MNKLCLYCFKETNGETYHKNCSMKLFGRYTAPVLNTEDFDIEQIAISSLGNKHAVTGVQKKLSLNFSKDSNKRLTIVNALQGMFILKPQSAEYPQMPEAENLCMRMAELLGIKVATNGLIPLQNGELAYITRRFDRQKKKKIAVEDFCQLSELQTERKYHSSHEKVAKLIEKYSSLPGDDIVRFFELVVYCFVIGNNDMHLKNFSLNTNNIFNIHLSLAYDLLPVRLFLSENEDPEQFALTLNGKKRKIQLKDFKQFAENLNIKDKTFNYILKKQISKKDEMLEMVSNSLLNNDNKIQLKNIITKNLGLFE